MALQNPQTFVRLRRIEIRQFANSLGRIALENRERWKDHEQAREVKRLTEEIAKRLRDTVTIGRLADAFSDLTSSIDDLISISESPYFKTVLARVPYYQPRNPAKKTHGVELHRLIVTTQKEITEYSRLGEAGLGRVERVMASIPEQAVAPLRFEVVQGILKLRLDAAYPSSSDEVSVEYARSELLESGAAIIQYLETSNQDARLIEIAREMHRRIEDRVNVVQLGMHGILFATVTNDLSGELPTVWAAQMKAYASNIGMFVSQFPDWIRFSENSARADFTPAEARELKATGERLVDELRRDPLVDQNVWRGLSYLISVISDRAKGKARGLFAALTSIGNLVAVVARWTGRLLGSLTAQARVGAEEGVKESVKTITKTLLLAGAASAALTLAPISSRIFQSHWMDEVGRLLKEVSAGELGGGAD